MITDYTQDTQTRIEQIKEELRTTPYHKGTEHHIGRLRARLAILQNSIIERQGGGGGGGGKGFAIKKFGDANVVLVGFPSVGKSTLVNAVTSANSKIASYPFSTLTVIPGMMDYRGAQIQILDVPGLITGAASGRGRGKQVLAVARNADLLIIMGEANHLEQITTIKNELFEAGVKIDANKPKITIVKMEKGGIKINTSANLKNISKEDVENIAKEFRIINAEVTIGSSELGIEDLIDGFMGNRIYIPSITVVNKIDFLPVSEIEKFRQRNIVPISAQNKIGLEELKEEMWKKLAFIKIYLKPKAGKDDRDKPLILKNGQTVMEAAEKVSLELAAELKEAKVWGKSAKFPGQTVSINHVLQDEDAILFI